MLCISTQLKAEGYYSDHKGARTAGRAGAVVARADDLSAAEYNPAGFAKMRGTTFQLGNRFSYNQAWFERAPTNSYGDLGNGAATPVTFPRSSNETPLQGLDPLIGVHSDFGLEDWGFALSAASPSGISHLSYPIDGGQRYMMVERRAQILVYSASFAWKFHDLFGLGASLQWVHVPRLDYSLVVNGNPAQASANPASGRFDLLAQVSGSDPFTPNAVLGAWLRPHPSIEIGLSGQVIPTQIKTRSTLDISPLALDTDIELSRDGAPAEDVRLILPLPMTARAGARYIHERKGAFLFDLELDVTYRTWSKVERFQVETDGLVATLQGQTVDIDTIVIDKQWRDSVSVNLGGDYALLPDILTLRGGTFFEQAVASPSHYHVDFIAAQQLGAALGASLHLRPFEFALAYGYRFAPQRTTPESDAAVYQESPASYCEAPYDDPNTCHPSHLGSPSPAVNAGRYFAASHSASVDLIYRY